MKMRGKKPQARSDVLNEVLEKLKERRSYMSAWDYRAYGIVIDFLEEEYKHEIMAP